MPIKDYFLPKSLVYTGQHQNIDTTITHMHYDDQSLEITDDFKPKLNKKHYIKVVGLSDVKKVQSLKDYYKVDPLILEDIFHVRQRNKLELKEDYLFGVFHMEYMKDNDVIQDYMSVLLFKDTLITFHEKEPTFLSVLPELIKQHHETKTKTIDYLFYHLLDIVTDHHLDVFDYIEHEADQFEEAILDSKIINQEAFYMIRKHLLRLKSSVSPILDQLQTVLSKKHLLFEVSNSAYFDDLIDHLQRLEHHLTQSRELMRNLLDLHINNQSHRMNQIMTTLTLFSAIFIPLSFLTGFFGMNFVHFEVLEYEHALAIFIGLCFLLAFFMVMLFRKMKWF